MEKWDLYDAEGRLLNQTMYRGGKVPEGCYHRVVEAIFLNSRGEILLQKRSLHKKLYPEILWYLTGGAVLAGESVEEACIREVKEEMGFVPDMKNARLIHHCVVDGLGFIRDVFLIFQDMPIENMHFQQDEVDDAMWLFPEDIPSEPAEWQAFSFMPHLKEVFPFLQLESMRIRIPCGVYRHYKGRHYRVTGLALHSETTEPMVIYRALYGTEEMWVRPAAMWNETVMVNGMPVHRFQITGE